MLINILLTVFCTAIVVAVCEHEDTNNFIFTKYVLFLRHKYTVYAHGIII